MRIGAFLPAKGTCHRPKLQHSLFAPFYIIFQILIFPTISSNCHSISKMKKPGIAAPSHPFRTIIGQSYSESNAGPLRTLNLWDITDSPGNNLSLFHPLHLPSLPGTPREDRHLDQTSVLQGPPTSHPPSRGLSHLKGLALTHRCHIRFLGDSSHCYLPFLSSMLWLLFSSLCF